MQHKYIIGWEEWLTLPELNLPAIKAKIDTGAKISTLHAFNIKEVVKNRRIYIRFHTQPFIRDPHIECNACVPVQDRRSITSSNGEKELRYIITTPLMVGRLTIEIELSLTNRNLMRFPMLLGRDAIKQFALVDPSRSYCLGKQTATEIKKLYRENKR